MADAPPLDRENAREALAAACTAAGLDASGAELVRLGENAVYRLPTPGVVARVMRSRDRLPDAHREVAVARWLADEEVPAIEPAAVDQPVEAAGRIVTFWVSATDREDYGTTRELGRLLRTLHSLSPPAGVSLPRLDPVGRALRRIEPMSNIDGVDRLYLLRHGAELTEGYEALTYSLPPGPVHGDANVGNVLRDRQGRALLMDLEAFGHGAREWDLIQTAIFYDRFGWHTEQEYGDFVATYGFDVLGWPGYPVLRDVREFGMVTWLAQNVGTDGAATAEFTKRMRTLRSGGSARNWSPL